MIQQNDSLPQVKDTVADVKKLVVDIQLWPLLKKKVEIDAFDIFKNSIKSELLWVSLTNGIASPVSKSMPASKEDVYKRQVLL